MADSVQNGFLRVDPTTGQGFGPLKVVVDSASTSTVDTELPAAAADGDATANESSPSVKAKLYLYNGTTWDRKRSATAAANTTGTGLTGVGVLGYDGTNYQNAGVVVGDTGQNALPIVPARKEVSFTTTTVQAVATTDISNYHWVSVHITSQGGSSTVAFQGSNDNTNWTACALVSAATVGNSAATSSTTATGIFHGAVPFRYFRLNVTGIASGTTAGVIEFFANAATLLTNAYVSNLTSASALADADSNPSTARTGANALVFNGTTWDRARSASAANQSATTMTGAAQVAQVGTWSVTSAPAAGNAASASKASGGGSVRHVITGFDFEAVAAGGAAPATTTVTVTVRDGATGAGTVLKTFNVRFNAQADGTVIARHSVTGLSLVGSAATAATVEFSAGGTNVVEACNLHGYSV